MVRAGSSAPEETAVKKTLLIATALTGCALSQSAAQETSAVLHSLPAEVQKNIEGVRAACRAYWNDRGIADSSTVLLYGKDIASCASSCHGSWPHAPMSCRPV
jgi:hypothetical protein